MGRGYSPPAPCAPHPRPELDTRVRVRRARCCPREATLALATTAGWARGASTQNSICFLFVQRLLQTIRPSPLKCRFKLHLTWSCAPCPLPGWGPQPGPWRGGAHRALSARSWGEDRRERKEALHVTDLPPSSHLQGLQSWASVEWTGGWQAPGWVLGPFSALRVKRGLAGCTLPPPPGRAAAGPQPVASPGVRQANGP